MLVLKWSFYSIYWWFGCWLYPAILARWKNNSRKCPFNTSLL